VIHWAIPIFRAALGGAAVAAALAGGPLRAATECEMPPELTKVEFKLPHVAERVKEHQPVTIVAIGGASTIGAAAGSPDLSYPHRLQKALAKFFPESQVNVVNKGVPRQSARQMFQRFPTDVLAEDPVLVVWEVGITDAVRGTGIEEFAATLQAGIDELNNHSIDVVLIDMQFSRSTNTVIDFERYLNALHRVADLNDVYVFPRYEAMLYWSEQHVFNFDDVSTEERARLAGRVYDCIGRQLAHAIRLAAE